MTGGALLNAISVSTYDCLRPLWTFDSDVQTVISEANVLLVAGEITSQSVDISTNAASLTQLLLFLQIAYNHEFYETSIVYDSSTDQTLLNAVGNISADPLFFADTLTLKDLRNQWITTLDSINGSHSQITSIEKLFQRYLNNSSLSSDYAERSTLYSALFTLQRQIGNNSAMGQSSPWYNLVSDQLVADIGRIANDASYNSSTEFLVTNALWTLAKMDALNPGTSYKAQEQITTAYRFFGNGTAPWIWAVRSLETNYGARTHDGEVLDIPAIKTSIKKKVFPYQHSFDGGNLLMITSLDPRTIQNLYDALQEVESQFFRLTTFLQPLPTDPNTVINLRIYGTKREYELYHTFLYNLSTNNGGIYIEADSTLYTYERTASESSYTLEELLKHEYVHYLDGRYLVQGFFGDSDSLYKNELITWHSEGLAEYLVGATREQKVLWRKNLLNSIDGDSSRLSLSSILSAKYSSGFKFYRYAAQVFPFLRKNHGDLLVTHFNNIRGGNFLTVSNFFTSLAGDTNLGSEYDLFLTSSINDIQSGSQTFAEDVSTVLTPSKIKGKNSALILSSIKNLGYSQTPQLTLTENRFLYKDTYTITTSGIAKDIPALLREDFSTHLDSVLNSLDSSIENFKSTTAWFGDIVVNGNSGTAAYYLEGPYALYDTGVVPSIGEYGAILLIGFLSWLFMRQPWIKET